MTGIGPWCENPSGFQRRKAFDAVEHISKAVAKGRGKILSAERREALFSTKGEAYMDSVGEALNLGVNDLVDVLHTFFLDVV